MNREELHSKELVLCTHIHMSVEAGVQRQPRHVRPNVDFELVLFFFFKGLASMEAQSAHKLAQVA